MYCRGKSEWQGRWADGAEEWHGEWLDALKTLDHTFGVRSLVHYFYIGRILTNVKLDRMTVYS